MLNRQTFITNKTSKWINFRKYFFCMKGEIIPIFKSGYYRSNFPNQSARREMLCRENLAMIYSLLFSSSWDMCRVEEPIEQDEKISFGLFPFEVQIFKFLQYFSYSKTNQTSLLSHVNISRQSNTFTKWQPYSLIRPEM